MKARLVTVLVGLAATTLGAPVYSPDEARSLNFEPLKGAAVPEIGEIFVGHKTSAEHDALGMGYSKRDVNFEPVNGAEVPDIGEIFEGHKTSADHLAMGVGY